MEKGSLTNVCLPTAQHIILHLALQRVHLGAQPMELRLGVLGIALEVGHVGADRLQNFVHEVVRDRGH
jgi:hypothetical protein